MIGGELYAMTLEERLLRVLYELPASALTCVAEVERSHRDADERAIRRTLAGLADRDCAVLVAVSGRYRITAAGSERLATLAEARERSGEAVRS